MTYPLEDEDYDTLKKMLEVLELVLWQPIRPGVIEPQAVMDEAENVRAEMKHRDEAYLWKCDACGNQISAKDCTNSGSTLFGLTMRQISRLRIRWLSDGKKIEDI